MIRQTLSQVRFQDQIISPKVRKLQCLKTQYNCRTWGHESRPGEEFLKSCSLNSCADCRQAAGAAHQKGSPGVAGVKRRAGVAESWSRLTAAAGFSSWISSSCTASCPRHLSHFSEPMWLEEPSLWKLVCVKVLQMHQAVLRGLNPPESLARLASFWPFRLSFIIIRWLRWTLGGCDAVGLGTVKYVVLNLEARHQTALVVLPEARVFIWEEKPH